MSVLQEIVVEQTMAVAESVTIEKLFFKNRDKVKKGDVVIEFQTSKASVSVETEENGFIEYLVSQDQDVSVGGVLLRIHDSPECVKEDVKSQTDVNTSAESDVTFSAAALELMKKEGVNRDVFLGRDFVGVEDVREYLSRDQETSGGSSVRPDEDTENNPVKFKKISKAKQIEIDALLDVQSVSLNCVVGIYVDTQHLKSSSVAQQPAFKNSILPFTIAEVCRLLKKYPEFNAFYKDNTIGYYDNVSIGLAVDVGDGLKVVKLAGMGEKNIREIDAEILNLTMKCVAHKLTADDITGITFTITDLSAEGIHFFTPLINRRQSAILGISAVDEKLNRCMVTLTFDHRVSEGKRAAAFLRDLKQGLEGYGAGADSDGGG